MCSFGSIRSVSTAGWHRESTKLAYFSNVLVVPEQCVCWYPIKVPGNWQGGEEWYPMVLRLISKITMWRIGFEVIRWIPFVPLYVDNCVLCG